MWIISKGHRDFFFIYFCNRHRDSIRMTYEDSKKRIFTCIYPPQISAGTVCIYNYIFMYICISKNHNFGTVMFIYSEEATKFLRNLQLFLTGSTYSQKKVEISQNFCGLLRIYEHYSTKIVIF